MPLSSFSRTFQQVEVELTLVVAEEGWRDSKTKTVGRLANGALLQLVFKLDAVGKDLCDLLSEESILHVGCWIVLKELLEIHLLRGRRFDDVNWSIYSMSVFGHHRLYLLQLNYYGVLSRFI